MADENGKKEYAKARDILLKKGFFGDISAVFENCG